MILCHYLTPQNIVLPLEGKTKEELLTNLVTTLASEHGLMASETLLNAILARENEGSTFLPTGIAIPHARSPHVDEISLMMGVIPDGFCETPDSSPTYLILLFFSPAKEEFFGRHLKLLSKISAVFHDPDFVKEVASIGSKEEIFSLIQRKERETSEE